MDLPEANIRFGQFMLRLADHVSICFPQYASCLRDEIHGRKMTNERWNRVAAVLSSLSALPGVAFGPDEHDIRNPALSAIVIAQKMASATFGGRNNVESAIELCEFIALEIGPWLEKLEGRRSG